MFSLPSILILFSGRHSKLTEVARNVNKGRYPKRYEIEVDLFLCLGKNFQNKKKKKENLKASQREKLETETVIMKHKYHAIFS